MIKEFESKQTKLRAIKVIFLPITRKYQHVIDFLKPELEFRWISLMFLLTFYLFRVFYLRKFYLVTYILGIFLLQTLVLFITPTRLVRKEANKSPLLPKVNNIDTKPFIGKLSEFQLFIRFFQAVLISLICTFIPFLDFDVSWVVLFSFFLLLVVITLRQEIKKMVKYNYFPFNFKKKNYQRKYDPKNLQNSPNYNINGFQEKQQITQNLNNQLKYRSSPKRKTTEPPSPNNNTWYQIQERLKQKDEGSQNNSFQFVNNNEKKLI
ncbi:protein rer1 [Anaeramoeba flamelloides]|uniref:Protein rer1 n=1 Tax=Anaeramoeba flamelloides TaxID=1746091 RepID=A0ABQ8XZ48_9EUKA|nr:protein rer1 [Anaeramoeba flamelloides]